VADTEFRLASVLALREAQVDEAAIVVARIEVEVTHVEASRKRVAEQQQSTLSSMAPPRATVAADFHQAVEYLEHLGRRDQSLIADETTLRQKLDQARTTLRDRHQAATVLDKLRQRHEALLREDQQREERRTIDEVAGLQAERRRRE
jgi:flagellar export protein FliJ